MATTTHDEPARSVHLHRWIFRGIAGLVLWTIAAAWGFSSTWSADPHEAYTGLALAIVSYLCLAAVGIAYAMTRILRRSPDPARKDDRPSDEALQQWTSREIDVGDGHQRGSHVLIDVLLVPSAVAIGMTALAVVWHLAPGGGQ